MEGTGSIVFDFAFDAAGKANRARPRRAFVCRSVRADEQIARALFTYGTARTSSLPFFERTELMLFDAVDANGAPVYHTNVVLCVGRQFAVVCTECVRDPSQRDALVRALRWPSDEGAIAEERALVDISLAQVGRMCGNLLELHGTRGSVVVMSRTAHDAFTEDQLATIKRSSDLIATFDIPTIERIGGGSARCMLAEIFTE